MKTIKSILTTFTLAFAAISYGQASQVTYASADNVWKSVGNSHTTKFTLEGDESVVIHVMDSFEGLGNDVTYTVNSDGNIRTVEMTFSSAVEKQYVYKMLLVLGCQEVVIAGQSMTINDFLAMLNE